MDFPGARGSGDCLELAGRRSPENRVVDVVNELTDPNMSAGKNPEVDG